MRKATNLVIITCICILIFSCSDKVIIRKVANQVVQQTNYSLSELPNAAAPSRYNEWMYQNFIITEAIDQLGLVLKDSTYAQYGRKNIDFFCAYLNITTPRTAMKSLNWYYHPTEMWHCGMIAAFAEQQLLYPGQEKLHGIKIFEDFLSVAPRLNDGTFVRYKEGNYNSKAVQIDDIYMLSPYWVRMWILTKNEHDLNKAIEATFKYFDYLWDSDCELMHCLWLENTHKTASHFWGRGNGWFIMALTDLLANTPNQHPQRAKLMAIFNSVARGLKKYQDSKGLWHQVLNVPESFSESSCSGMFTYCILKGVNEGWLDRSFKSVGLNGWRGLKTKITDDYQIEDTCPPTDMSEDLNYFLNRSRITNDQHAIGPFLLAGLEVLKLKHPGY